MRTVKVKCEHVEKLKGQEFTVFYSDADEEYEKARNELIPFAEEYANNHNPYPFPMGEIKGRSGEELKLYHKWNHDWSITFMKKMDDLARGQHLI